MIEHVWRSGGTFQEWSEFFDHQRWLDAMRERPACQRGASVPFRLPNMEKDEDAAADSDDEGRAVA